MLHLIQLTQQQYFCIWLRFFTLGIGNSDELELELGIRFVSLGERENMLASHYPEVRPPLLFFS